MGRKRFLLRQKGSFAQETLGVRTSGFNHVSDGAFVEATLGCSFSRVTSQCACELVRAIEVDNLRLGE